MFCSMCGTKNPDDALFCAECGAKLETVNDEDTAQDTVENIDETPINPVVEQVNARRSSPIKTIIAVLIVIVLVIGGIFGACSLFADSIEDPVSYSVESINKGDYKLALKAFPKSVEEAILESESLTEMLREGYREMHNEMKTEFGHNAKASYKIVHKERLDRDELADLEEDVNELIEDLEYSDVYVEDYVEISAGYELDVELSVKGKDGYETQDVTVEVFKVNGRWCTIDMDFR